MEIVAPHTNNGTTKDNVYRMNRGKTRISKNNSRESEDVWSYRRKHQEHHHNIRFYKQSDNYAPVTLLGEFRRSHCTTTTWNFLMLHFLELATN